MASPPLPFFPFLESPFLLFFVSIMAPPNTPTITIKTGSFPTGSSSTDIVRAVTANFEDGDVLAVQVIPGNVAHITFSDPILKSRYEQAGVLDLGEIECPVYQPVVMESVLIYQVPFEGKDSEIRQFFQTFRLVKQVKKQTWPGTELYMGTRIIRMVRKRNIPCFVTIDNIRCKVWYKCQPVECDICHDNHKGADCPLRGKCLRRRQEGLLRAPAQMGAREVFSTTQYNLVRMENNAENQHPEASGETSSTPVLFDDDTPRDAEPVPKVLLHMYDNGAKSSRVPEFTWSLKKDEKSAKLRKELSVSFTVDTVVSTQDILFGFDATGIDIDSELSAIFFTDFGRAKGDA